MLNIVLIETTVENGNTVKKRADFDWHIGQENLIPYDKVYLVDEIQADGDELEYIINNFSHIPHAHHKKVVRYFGETAKFIIGNL